LYDYVARRYDPLLGRFIQADTIVPSPQSPQSLNRYAYVLNAPLRFTDPTGHFSREEIVQYLGVSDWAQVLAYFEAGGRLEGRWGWLAVLRQAELGWTVGMWSDCLGILQQPPDIAMAFMERDGGLWLYADTAGTRIEMSALGAGALVGAGGAYAIDGYYYGVSEKVLHPTYDPGRVDWTGIGIDALGIAADLLSLGVAGRLVNGTKAGWTMTRVGDALGGFADAGGLGRDLPRWVMTEPKRVDAAAFGLALDVAGVFPGLGVIWPDAIGIVLGVTEGYAQTP